MFISRPYYKIKKDYQRKNLQNPFFHRSQPGQRKYLGKLSMGGSLLVIGLAVWFFMFSSFWRWDQVRIEGLTRLPAGEIEKIIWEQGSASRWLFFRQSNIFAFDAGALERKVSAAYNFAGLAVKKTWPRTLTLKVSERPYAFIWREGSDLFYASADGYAIKEPAVSAADQKKYPILDNQTGQTMIGDKNKISVKGDYLNFFLELSADLAGQPDLATERFIVDREFNTLQVKFIAGPLAYFNTKASAADQVNNLVLVKNAKIKDNFSKTNYIDLRYGDKIFVHPEFSN
jgi:hypothetical protein